VVIVNAANQIEVVKKLYGLPIDRIAYVPLNPRTTAMRWANGENSEEPGMVLFFGRAHPHKGLEYLVKAQPIITRQVPHARIVISGYGWELERCRQMVQDSSKVEIHEGFVAPDVMATFFERASVVALPYLSASASGVLLTAYGFGKPVVATSVGCMPEYVEDGVTGLLVPPRNVEQLADAIIRLLSDDALRHRMGKNAASWFNEKQIDAALQTRQAYEKAIAIHRKN
jgi:glycosyltransferase involved in cell wall biosynthesis